MSRYLAPTAFLAAHGRRPLGWSVEDAEGYAQWLTRNQYENFPVVSFLLPRRLHQDFYNVYAFCRWADDLGDEMGDAALSLELLGWWRDELAAAYAGAPQHPVFLALAGTIGRHDLPRQPFEDLITAFELDQTATRYETWDQVVDYCTYSANPVGQLVLALGGYRDEGRVQLSNATCTALQLANHWQDVRRDWLERRRIYVPQQVLRQYGESHDSLVASIDNGQATLGIKAAIGSLCERTEGYFCDGRPLADTLDRRLAIDIELFGRAGMEVLREIRRLDFDTVRLRPRVSKVRRVCLLISAIASRSFRRQRTPGGGRPRHSRAGEAGA